TDGSPRRDGAEVVEAITGDGGADASADGGLREAVQHRRDAALLHPGRQQIAQRIGRGLVGVLIAVDPYAAAPRPLDLVEELLRLAPVVGPRNLYVPHLHVDSRPLTHPPHLADRLQA